MDTIDSIELVVNEVRLGILPRRKVRNLIHRVRTGRIFDKWEIDRAPGIRAIYEPQFRKVNEEVMSWKNFTYLWDIHPTSPLVIVTAREWVHSGGTYERVKEAKNGEVYQGRCIPTAFTNQPL